MADTDTHETIQRLLGVHALDATDADEAAAVERHVAECPTCRAELDELREVAGQLGNDDLEPPPLLWERIAEQITTEPPDELTALRKARHARSGRTTMLFAAAASIVLIAGITALGFFAIGQHGKLDRANRQLASLQSGPTLEQAARHAAGQPGARQIALKATSGAVRFEVTIARDGTAYVQPQSSTGTLDSSLTYQLWGVHDGNAISLGLLGSEPGVARVRLPEGISALAITIERNPGVVTSHNTPVAQASI